MPEPNTGDVRSITPGFQIQKDTTWIAKRSLESLYTTGDHNNLNYYEDDRNGEEKVNNPPKDEVDQKDGTETQGSRLREGRKYTK